MTRARPGGIELIRGASDSDWPPAPPPARSLLYCDYVRLLGSGYLLVPREERPPALSFYGYGRNCRVSPYSGKGPIWPLFPWARGGDEQRCEVGGAGEVRRERERAVVLYIVDERIGWNVFFGGRRRGRNWNYNVGYWFDERDAVFFLHVDVGETRKFADAEFEAFLVRESLCRYNYLAVSLGRLDA